MELIASLDMGNEKMVMALGMRDHDVMVLRGIEVQLSQGVERGVVKDWDKARAGVRSLLTKLVKDKEVKAMNVCLSGDVLHIREHKVKVSVQKRTVERSDLLRAEQRCRESVASGRSEEVVDVMPVSYALDGGEAIADPLGKTGQELEVIYLVYKADSNYLTGLVHLFDGSGIEGVYFYPVARAYGEALNVTAAGNLALIDMGAAGVNVVQFRDGLLEYEARLPLGVRTIDSDIMQAFDVETAQARKLKHENGEALRSVCKNKKIQIPDTNLTLESRDLATVVQSRMEELLEGAVYLLQKWGYDCLEDKIVLTGGGSRLVNIDVLLHRMSGHPVERAMVEQVQVPREEVLRIPEYMLALGVLLCRTSETEESGLGKKWFGRLKNMMGI